MKLFDGCLLACDVDGTLVINGKVPKRNVEKIKFFTDNGGIFSLSTGRSAGALTSATSAVEGISASVVANGCMIYDFETNEVLDSVLIDKRGYDIIFEIKEALPFVGIELHAGTDVYVLKRTDETDEHEKYESLTVTQVKDEDVKNLRLNKVLYAINDKENIPVIRNVIKGKETGCDFLDTAAILGDKERFYLEQIPSGISKAEGVKKLAKLKNIKKGNLFAIGDYFNDIEMLEYADIGAAPPSAPDVVKKKADFITGNTENGSVADFIDYLTELRRK